MIVLYAFCLFFHVFYTNYLSKKEGLTKENEEFYISSGWSFNSMIILLLMFLLFQKIFKILKILKDQKQSLLAIYTKLFKKSDRALTHSNLKKNPVLKNQGIETVTLVDEKDSPKLTPQKDSKSSFDSIKPAGILFERDQGLLLIKFGDK